MFDIKIKGRGPAIIFLILLALTKSLQPVLGSVNELQHSHKLAQNFVLLNIPTILELHYFW